ncbi:hypothetical protein F5888DRAFT_1893787 [Russula emetica]|nr:hypothetical protein F5888DRAFT_1893787 [Russula emetica]
MHHHKIVAQILLILTILNSVLAAPIGKIPQARGAVAVRVPAEGVVLVKRPQPATSEGPNTETQSMTSPQNHEVPPETPETEETYYDASSEELGPPAPNQAASSEEVRPPASNQAASSEELGPPAPNQAASSEEVRPPAPNQAASEEEVRPPAPNQAASEEEVRPPAPNQAASEEEVRPLAPNQAASEEVLRPPVTNQAASSGAAWKQKMLTPENIKSAKILGITGLATAAYLSLLIPEIKNDGGQNSKS